MIFSGGPVDDSTFYRRVSAPLEKLSETNLYIRGLLADVSFNFLLMILNFIIPDNRP